MTECKTPLFNEQTNVDEHGLQLKMVSDLPVQPTSGNEMNGDDVTWVLFRIQTSEYIFYKTVPLYIKHLCS